MKHKIGGVEYEIRFRALRNVLGDCTDPRKSNPQIRIDKALSGQRLLEVEIHELLHAEFWDLAEEAIDRAARDLSSYLYKRGYRRGEEGAAT